MSMARRFHGKPVMRLIVSVPTSTVREVDHLLKLNREMVDSEEAIGLNRHAHASGEGANGGSALRGVYIANVVKCRPPGNRNPHPDEVAKCDPYLARQVALVRPKIILAMGRFAVQSLLQTTEPIGKLRGQVHRYHGVPVIVTYHPAYLLRNLPEKAKAWADLCLAMDVAERGG